MMLHENTLRSASTVGYGRRASLLRQCFLLPMTILLATTINTAQGLIPPEPVVHTACGFVAGSAGAIAAYPIDYVKSQLQTESGREKYSGGLEAASDIVKNSKLGILALYRGVMVNVIGIAPEKTIKLSVNEAVRLAISTQFGYLPILGEVVAGGCAGMTQVSVTNPLEVVKVKMQTSDMTFRDVMAQLKSFSDLYQGAGACIARDVVFSAILFPFYEHAKVAFAASLISMFASGADMDVGGVTVITFWANLLAGSLAAAPAAAISTPADVVKTRMQQARKDDEKRTIPRVGDDKKSEPNFIEVFQTMVREEGPEVMFSGWFERVVRSVPQFGVTLAVFDVLTTMAVQNGLMLS